MRRNSLNLIELRKITLQISRKENLETLTKWELMTRSKRGIDGPDRNNMRREKRDP